MHSTDPTPARVAETITRLDTTARAPLNAYWLSIIGDRKEYTERLQPLLAGRGLGVLIVRGNGFTNANALMVDLVQLLEQNKAPLLTALASRSADAERIGIVLLSHRELAMGQAYSPITWPSWVPGAGNRETTCFITDVSRRIEVPLNGSEIDVAQINGALFAVEQALVRRLLEVHHRSPSVQQAFFQRIRRSSDTSWVSLLAGAKQEQRSVRSSQSYRPGAKSIVRRVWDLSVDTSPARLAVAQPELAVALGITDDLLSPDRWEGLLTVLARPRRTPPSAAQRFCRSILTAVPAACQFVTCSAHADRYHSFPVNLLIAVVDDLYKALTSIETSLIHLSDDSSARVL